MGWRPHVARGYHRDLLGPLRVLVADVNAGQARFVYETALKSDQFVVVAHGSVEDVSTARRILERTGAISVDENRAAAA